MAHAWDPPLERIGDDSGAGVGLVEGVVVGVEEDAMVGVDDDEMLGVDENVSVGVDDGVFDGLVDAVMVGVDDGVFVGLVDALIVGLFVTIGTAVGEDGCNGGSASFFLLSENAKITNVVDVMVMQIKRSTTVARHIVLRFFLQNPPSLSSAGGCTGICTSSTRAPRG